MIPGINRHPVPDWLKVLSDLERLPLRDILTRSVFYPSCGLDGKPIKFLGGFVHSFVYVDYARNSVAVSITPLAMKSSNKLTLTNSLLRVCLLTTDAPSHVGETIEKSTLLFLGDRCEFLACDFDGNLKVLICCDQNFLDHPE